MKDIKYLFYIGYIALIVCNILGYTDFLWFQILWGPLIFLVFIVIWFFGIVYIIGLFKLKKLKRERESVNPKTKVWHDRD